MEPIIPLYILTLLIFSAFKYHYYGAVHREELHYANECVSRQEDQTAMICIETRHNVVASEYKATARNINISILIILICLALSVLSAII